MQTYGQPSSRKAGPRYLRRMEEGEGEREKEFGDSGDTGQSS